MHFRHTVYQIKFSLKSETYLLLVHIISRQHFDWGSGPGPLGSPPAYAFAHPTLEDKSSFRPYTNNNCRIVK